MWYENYFTEIIYKMIRVGDWRDLGKALDEATDAALGQQPTSPTVQAVLFPNTNITNKLAGPRGLCAGFCVVVLPLAACKAFLSGAWLRVRVLLSFLWFPPSVTRHIGIMAG